jgi:hypothetical protein
MNFGKRACPARAITVSRNTRATVSSPDTGFIDMVIWGARLFGAAVMMALLFLWTAGWL